MTCDNQKFTSAEKVGIFGEVAFCPKNLKVETRAQRLLYAARVKDERCARGGLPREQKTLAESWGRDVGGGLKNWEALWWKKPVQRHRTSSTMYKTRRK
ncbi:MAG: hypothetical protein GY737_18910 [Desulfobacteraceae bacterium]|nr:hypothetical protein [Desulfobacteraceae bacterium]